MWDFVCDVAKAAYTVEKVKTQVTASVVKQVWDQTTDHVAGCADRVGRECAGLFVDVATLGAAESTKDNLVGCWNQDKTDCGSAFVDLATLGIPVSKCVQPGLRAIRKAVGAKGVVKGRGGPVAANALPALPNALSGGAADTHVYFGTRGGKNVYTGITNNLTRRGAQHGERFDQLVRVTNAPVTRGEARSIEQALIERNPGFENKINSISPSHSYYDEAVSWGEAWLRQNGF